jgi:hypothetical protein
LWLFLRVALLRANPTMSCLRVPRWARRTLLAPVGMLPSAASLPPTGPRVRCWKNDFRHPLHQLLDLPSHRRDTQAEEVVRLQNQALAFRHLLVPDRRGHVQKRPEPDLLRRAEPTPYQLIADLASGLRMLLLILCLRHLLLLAARVETVHHEDANKSPT